MKSKLILFLCLALILVMSVGCNSDEVSQEGDNQVLQQGENEEAEGNKKENEEEENEEKDKEYPQRVIGGTVAVVEMLDLLGVEMVGVPNSRYTLPESCDNAERIGQPMNPDIEIVKSLNSDIFVSVSSLQPRLEKSLKDSNIESLFVNNNSYDDILNSIEMLGNAFGKETEAKGFIDKVNGKVSSILKDSEGKENPKVMILFGTPESIMFATDKSFVGSLVNKLDGVNITEEIGDFNEAYMPISMENALKTQPHAILILTHANPEESKKMFEKEFADNEIWNNFEAIKNDKVYNLDNKYFGVSGNIRLVEAIESLAEMLY